MRRAGQTCLLILGAAALSACGTEVPHGTSDPQAVDQTVRQYIDLRNHGDLHGLLNKSCEKLYSSTQNIMDLPPDQQRGITESMRQHPVQVHTITVDHSQDFRFDATLTGSANTPQGQQSASQHVTVREYQDGYRVCMMTP